MTEALLISETKKGMHSEWITTQKQQQIIQTKKARFEPRGGENLYQEKKAFFISAPYPPACYGTFKFKMKEHFHSSLLIFNYSPLKLLFRMCLCVWAPQKSGQKEALKVMVLFVQPFLVIINVQYM